MTYKKVSSEAVNEEKKCLVKSGKDRLLCGKTFILVPFGNHAKDIKPGCLLGWDVNILILELPAIWNITICTDMAFVGII